jgi:ATP-binding cassette subfamily C protein LapB
VVVAGVYGILGDSLSYGAVLACSILTSRTIAPLGMITAVFTRLQNARVSKRALDGLLSLPLDHAQNKDKYHKANLLGSYHFDKVLYGYNPDEPPAIAIQSLRIEPGEKIAILGRVGSGKSTLLRLAGGLAQPLQGQISFNGINMSLVDVADVRRDIGFLMQDASLFYGTLRDNMLLANPRAKDEEVLAAMHIACADQLLLNQSRGLDLVLREGGQGLSGGQKQTLMLARLILRSPNVLLLDEPTASLDDATEMAIIQRLGQWVGDRTMLVATHRYAMLSLVSRIIVIDGGRIVLDGPRDTVLNSLKQNPPAAGK